MSYLNNQVGYREALLETRSIIKRGNYAVIEPDGIVKNVIPGFENTDVTILGSPALGASFVDYLVTMKKGGKNTGFGGEGIEIMLYVVNGKVLVKNADKEVELTSGGFFYSPASLKIEFENKNDGDTKIFLYKRRYVEVAGHKAYTVAGNANDIEWKEYEGMANCHIKDFLPSATELGFDMNFHILKFKLGASHGYIETHVQQHGALIVSGKGMYRLDGEWIPVKEGDYLYMGEYCPQACYAVGKEDELIYVYSKDCNRDIDL